MAGAIRSFFEIARMRGDGFGIVGCWFCWGRMRKRYMVPLIYSMPVPHFILLEILS